MGEAPTARPPALLEWGVAARALPGEAVSGDRHLVQPFPNGVLAAVADGLGHGAEAARAAEQAAAALARHASAAVAELVQFCHAALRRTRGVVLSLAAFNALDDTLTWVGVGNVEGILVRADPARKPPRDYLLLRGGVLGYQLPPLRPAVLPVARGDLLVFATDGIASPFAAELTTALPPQLLADRVLARHGKSTDDALVLAARYLGGRS